MNDEYERMFSDLPEHVRAMAVKLAVKEMVVARHTYRVEEATNVMTKLRNEAMEMAEEIEMLKVELRDACRECAAKKENKV